MNRLRTYGRELTALSLAANAAIGATAVWQYRHNKNLKEALCGSEQARKLDPKTGLLTYKSFVEEVKERIGPAQRESDKGRLHGLILGDLDNFSAWNSKLTHPVVDKEALIPAAESIKSSIRPSNDLAARFGGEEIVIFLEDTDVVGTLTVCDRIQDQVNSIHPDGSSPLGITLSYAPLEQGGDYDYVFERASAALIEAKQIPGKNQTVRAEI